MAMRKRGKSGFNVTTQRHTSSFCFIISPSVFVPFRGRSETDTEVIAHLVGLEMDSDPSMHVKAALAKTVAKLDGTWGLAVIDQDK